MVATSKYENKEDKAKVKKAVSDRLSVGISASASYGVPMVGNVGANAANENAKANKKANETGTLDQGSDSSVNYLMSQAGGN